MGISTVKDNTGSYEVTLTDGTVLWVPKDSQNVDFTNVQAWVAGGGIITT